MTGAPVGASERYICIYTARPGLPAEARPRDSFDTHTYTQTQTQTDTNVYQFG